MPGCQGTLAPRCPHPGPSSPARGKGSQGAGNKRIGWLATVVFYGLNSIELEAPDDDAYDLVIAVASSAMPNEEAAAQLARWH